MTGLAIVGCGFVANYYLLTLSKSQTLKVEGVFDLVHERAVQTAQHYAIYKTYRSLDELLADEAVKIVLNLTNPRNHYDVTRACLEAGKHVYTEKPLAMTIEEAKALARLAEKRLLQLSSAPCSLLSETAQTVWKALREDKIGKVRLVYAELDDDLLHKMELQHLHTRVGIPWPAKDELEIGCTLEHAGYYLTWLAAFFGPAKAVTAFGACLIPDKLPRVQLDPPDAPDFSVACIEFHSGTVARVTCGIVAPRNHSLTMFGDAGIMEVQESWNYGAPARIRPREWNRDVTRTPTMRLAGRIWRKIIRHAGCLKALDKLWDFDERRYPLVRRVPDFDWEMGLRMDFSRGVEELALAIEEKRESRVSTGLSLHVTELALAIHRSRELNQPYQMTTTFEPVAPMPWAE